MNQGMERWKATELDHELLEQGYSTIIFISLALSSSLGT